MRFLYRQFQKDVSYVLPCGSFELRKWIDYDVNHLKKFIMNDNLNVLPIRDNINNKTLGIYWNACLDILQYLVPSRDMSKLLLTKRLILSTVYQIYDPLGLIGLIVVGRKWLIQTLWKLNGSWDSEVPRNIAI